MEEQKIELRSDDVQEILGTPPSWIVRWGTTVLLCLVAALITAGWLIRYPDVINARVVLTTTVAPVEIVARTEGHISQLLVKDNDEVKRGDVLVVLQSTANYEDVMALDRHVTALQRAGVDTFQSVRPARHLELGELQTDYSVYVQNLDNLQFGGTVKVASNQQNVSSIQQQVDKLEQSISLDERSKVRAKADLDKAQGFYEKQKELYSIGAISLVDLERERKKLSEAERLVDQYDESMVRKRNDIISLRKNIGEISFSTKEDASTLTIRLRESLNALRSSLDKWKQTFLLTASIDGKASLNAAFFSAQQFVKQGDQVLTIVPTANDRIIGRVLLPIQGSGKVKPGQQVILRLDPYPYYEYGTIEGKVESKSIIPKDNMYSIQVAVPNQLVTSYNRTLDFQQQLQGEALIITEKKRFLERIWEQVFAKATAYQ